MHEDLRERAMMTVVNFCSGLQSGQGHSLSAEPEMYVFKSQGVILIQCRAITKHLTDLSDSELMGVADNCAESELPEFAKKSVQ